jgi:ATPase subunit of ABC transporter with duplicated ATPase domains
MILAAGALEKQQRQRAHLESFVNRFKAQASKARQAQSRMKALAKMEELAPLRAAAEFSFEFREPLSRTESAAGDGRRQRRLQDPRRARRQGRPQDHRLEHQVLAADRPAYRPAGRERRRQVDADQDHRRRTRR